jgi:hypothetical protein
MPIQHGSAHLRSTTGVTANAVVVTTREELTKALRKGTAPIIIRNKKLARLFALALWSSSLWVVGDRVADIVKYAISQGYGVNLKADWSIGRIGVEIILTPMRVVPLVQQAH